MMQRAGTDIEISKILVKSISETRKDVDASLLTENFEDIINDDSIQIVVEVMGGIEPARTFIRRCLNAGKSVVSANKDLIAVHGRELLDAAKENNVDFMFEASCAGGIPIIRSLKQSLVANDITEIMESSMEQPTTSSQRWIRKAWNLMKRWRRQQSLAMPKPTRQPISKGWMRDGRWRLWAHRFSFKNCV